MSTLRELADRMQPQIDGKLRPSIASQRPTRRRARIAEGMYQDARQLQKVQAALRALADAHDGGVFLRCGAQLRSLAGIKTRAAVEAIMDYYGEDKAMLARKKALECLMGNQPIEVPHEVEARRVEAKLLGLRIPGFFTTPRSLADRMVQMANIQPGMEVLEPSAGSGNIADAIQEACPGCHLTLVEINGSLVDILKAKGYDGNQIYHTDFLRDNEEIRSGFDRIVMNPPFEKNQDIDHVLHAFDLLRPGGRLVAIVSEHPFFASDAKSAIFRNWLVEHYGSEEKLPPGIFRNQATSTDVAARMVYVPKLATGT